MYVREVSSDEAWKLAEKHGATFLAVSALNGSNISEIFSTLTADIYHHKMKISKEHQLKDSKRKIKFEKSINKNEEGRTDKKNICC